MYDWHGGDAVLWNSVCALLNHRRLHPMLQTGFADVQIGKYLWRVYYLNDPARDLYVAVGQKAKERTSLARVLMLVL